MIHIDSKFEDVLVFAAQWLSGEQLKHAIRVMQYAQQMAQARGWCESAQRHISNVALLHDLLEDTNCPEEELGSDLLFYINLLTHYRDIKFYDDYINKIFIFNSLAILVKQADMKDHFCQLDTITPELIEKYLPYVGRFIN